MEEIELDIEENEYKDTMHRLLKPDEYTSEALLALEQMFYDNFNCEPYSMWATNEECIVDVIRSIFGKDTLQKRCDRIRAAWAEYNRANW